MEATPSQRLTQTNQKVFDFDIDQIIHKLTSNTSQVLNQQQIQCLLRIGREIFLMERSLVNISAPAIVIGDLHGQFEDLLRIFSFMGYPNRKSSFVFLGDYVDRGKKGTQVFCLLLALKIKYPSNVILLRGNHECASLNKTYGFYHECVQRYSAKLWKSFVSCFDCMPPAALISKSILCMHGGLTPSMIELSQIYDIPRPSDIIPGTLMSDLLWGDPQTCHLFEHSNRGTGFFYGKQVVDLFCQANDLELIVRAHQIVEDGYEFKFNKKTVTIFSAPNYCNKFSNNAGILQISAQLQCKILTMAPKNKRNQKKSLTNKNTQANFQQITNLDEISQNKLIKHVKVYQTNEDISSDMHFNRNGSNWLQQDSRNTQMMSDEQNVRNRKLQFNQIEYQLQCSKQEHELMSIENQINLITMEDESDNQSQDSVYIEIIDDDDHIIDIQ